MARSSGSTCSSGIPLDRVSDIVIETMRAMPLQTQSEVLASRTPRAPHVVAARIGHSGMVVVLRLSAFIVLSIGVQIAWNGIKALLKEIGVPA